jgi:proteasome assembly chaperone (PAC2) family protein
MVIVDLQELEERARLAAESIGGVVLEPEALLLVISEIRRMKSQLGEQHGYLIDMRGELLQLRTELMVALARGPAPQAAPLRKQGKISR